MSATANEVLDRTMRDEQFLDLFKRDPDAALDQYEDLTDKEREALKSGDEDRVRGVVDDLFAQLVIIVIFSSTED